MCLNSPMVAPTTPAPCDKYLHHDWPEVFSYSIIRLFEFQTLQSLKSVRFLKEVKLIFPVVSSVPFLLLFLFLFFVLCVCVCKKVWCRSCRRSLISLSAETFLLCFSGIREASARGRSHFAKMLQELSMSAS